MRRVAQSQNSATRALSAWQERKQIEALAQAQNVLRDKEYNTEQFDKIRERMLNRAIYCCEERDDDDCAEQGRDALVHDNDIP